MVFIVNSYSKLAGIKINQFTMEDALELSIIHTNMNMNLALINILIFQVCVENVVIRVICFPHSYNNRSKYASNIISGEIIPPYL